MNKLEAGNRNLLEIGAGLSLFLDKKATEVKQFQKKIKDDINVLTSTGISSEEANKRVSGLKIRLEIMTKEVQYLEALEAKTKNPLSIEVSDIEKCVLGAIILENKGYGVLKKVYQSLEPEYFATQKYQKLYEVCCDLYKQGLPIDILSIHHHLLRNGITEITKFDIMEVMSCVSGSYNIEYHIFLLRERWAARELLRTFYEGIDAIFSYEDPIVLIEKVKTVLLKISPHEQISPKA